MSDRAAIQTAKANKAREWARNQYEPIIEEERGKFWIVAGLRLITPDAQEHEPKVLDLIIATEAQLARWWTNAIELVGLGSHDLDAAMTATRPTTEPA